jgi:hypothetical protein
VDFDNIPWFTNSSFEIMCRRTSGNSSLSIWRNIGRRWSIVLGILALALYFVMSNILLLAKNRSESTDLGSESSSNVLGSVGHKVFYSGHDIVKEGGSVNKLAETCSLLSTDISQSGRLHTWNLPSNRCSDFGLSIFEELNKCRNKISRDDLIVYSFGNL